MLEELKENVIQLFYNEHLTSKEIVTKVGISYSYVTKIVKEDDRYAKEKDYRKEISKIKRKKAQNNFIKCKRDNKRIEDNYSIVQLQHKQAVREMSKSNHLTNENYRKWNYSAYKYNPKKRRYELDESLGRSADVPKYIKERK